MQNIVEIRNLNKSYKNKKILSDVNLKIAAGEFLLIRGVSGAGKSTLLNIIAGLEKSDSGDVIVDTENASGLKGTKRKAFYQKEIGFIYQGFYLQPQLSAEENISLAGYIGGMKMSEIKQRMNELMNEFKISEIAKSKPSEISGGQVERVCIARAIFLNPKIVLADEPTNNLDKDNVELLLNDLKRLSQSGTTIIIASHDERVEQYATRIVDIVDGKVSDTANVNGYEKSNNAGLTDTDSYRKAIDELNKATEELRENR